MLPRLAAVSFALVLSGAGCARSAPPPAARSESSPAQASRASEEQAPPPDTTGASKEDEQYTWKAETRSPRAAVDDPDNQTLLAKCGQGDSALQQVALRLARRQVRGLPLLDMPEINFALRTEGSSYVWARAWTVEGQALDDDETLERMERWLGTFDDGGERRCGVAKVTTEQPNTVVAAVALDAVANLEPIPTRARLGQWLSVKTEMLVPTREAKVVVLAPRGAPRTVPTSVHDRAISASFSVDQPGTWLVQVLATVKSGPRPVAEAMVHVDARPPHTFRATPTPGEKSAAGAGDDRAALKRMMDAARVAEGLGRLRRDRRLDAIAQAHADAMRDAGRIGHNVGDGDPKSRLEAANLPLKAGGENVAHAANLRRAHRALWSSPSHRGNLLHKRFDTVGIGIAEDPDGSVWVCQVFADF